MTDAWTDYQREQWRNRTNRRRYKTRSTEYFLMRCGVNDLQPEDVKLYRQMKMKGMRIASFAIVDGKISWITKPREVTLEELQPDYWSG